MAGSQAKNAVRRFKQNASCVCCVSRRDLLSGFAAVAAGAALPAVDAIAQTPAKPASNTGRIDVHRHFVPPGYVVDPRRAYLNDRSTIPRQLEDMDRSGVSLSVMSISASALAHPDAAQAAKFSRMSNEYSAKLCTEHPGRFGHFAYLPLPDVEASLKEIEYALGTLKADGVFLLTNYGNKFLGDPAFEPVFQELNRRRAVVYTHPTGHPCCESLVPGLRDADIEYGTNTTRAIAKFVFSGSSRRYPDIRVIWSHAGGTMPFLIRRFDKRVKESPEFQPILPEGFSAEARKFYYDIAQAPERAPMAALKAVAPVSQMLFGTDWPHLTTEEHVTGLQNSGVFDAAELKAIDRDNALRLMPTLRSAS
jgi:6-methylsalicylate decarboxylase